MSKKVSVIISSLNTASFIRECIQSVLGQTYKDYEVIVVDGGSRDESLDIIKSFLPGIKLIEKPFPCQWNEFRAHHRNEGIKIAKGDYLLFLDGDDLLLPEALESWVKMLDSEPSLGLVYSDLYFCDQEGRNTGLVSEKFRPYSGKVFNHLFERNFIPVHAALVPRKVIEKVGLFDESVPACADWDLWLRISYCYHIKYLAKPLGKYRIHQANISKKLIIEPLSKTAIRSKILNPNRTSIFNNLVFSRKQRAFWYYRIGRMHYYLGRKKEAAVSFLRSILLCPFYFKPYLFILSRLAALARKIFRCSRERRSNCQTEIVFFKKVMKIVQVSCFCYPGCKGGGVIYCYDLAMALNVRHQVKIFCGDLSPKEKLYQQKEETFNDVEVTKIVIHPQNLYHHIFVHREFYNRRIGRVFSQYLQMEKPDIVHFHALQGLGASLILATKRLNIPSVLTLHDGWWLCAKQYFMKPRGGKLCKGAGFGKCLICTTLLPSRKFLILPRLFRNLLDLLFRKFYLRYVFNKIDIISSPSSFLAEKYINGGVRRDRITVSRNAISMGWLGGFKKTPSQQIRFGFTGAMRTRKGYFLLLKAVRLLDRRNFTLHIWGQANKDVSEKMRRQFPRLNLIFHKEYQREQVGQVFSCIDVLLYPTMFQENCPLGILESLAARTPVIASRTGGVPELIEDGINGLLFEPGNAEDLARKMNVVISQKALIEKMQKNIKPVKSIEEQSVEIEKIYQELREKRRKVD